MADEKYEGRAIVTRKMTRDGLHEQNQVTGEERRISSREAAKEYNASKSDSTFIGMKHLSRQKENNSPDINEERRTYRKKNHRTAAAGDNAADKTLHKTVARIGNESGNAKQNQNKESTVAGRSGALNQKESASASSAASDSSLEAEQKIDYSKTTLRYQRKYDRLKEKTDKAFERAPKKRRLTFSDMEGEPEESASGTEESGRMPRRRLRFEDKIDQRTGKAIVKKPSKKLIRRTVKYEINQKIESRFFQYDDDTVGNEAIHKGYKAARFTYLRMKGAIKNPYERYKELSEKLDKTGSKYQYHKFLDDNKEVLKDTKLYNKRYQKKKYQQVYAKTLRKSGSAVFAEKAASDAGKKAAQRKLIEALAKSKVVIAAAIMLLLFGAIFLVAGGISGAAGGIAGEALLIAAYKAEDVELTDADAYYTELETDLQWRIDHIEEEKTGYDEYQYECDDIGHDPIALMSYLDTIFGEFTLEEVVAELESLFKEQYTLSFEEKWETRTKTVIDPETLEEKEVEYEVHILITRLKNNNLAGLVEGKIPEADKILYDVYKEYSGAHQVMGNPFDIDWTSKISSQYGWRVHPVDNVKKFHAGVDIALPTGTPIKSVMTGTVITAKYSESAGNYIEIRDETGYVSIYMHCNTMNVHVGDTVEKGDLIATVGNTGKSTGAHLHLQIEDNKGNTINPLLLVSSYGGKTTN